MGCQFGRILEVRAPLCSEDFTPLKEHFLFWGEPEQPVLVMSRYNKQASRSWG